jgi:hypothetical protein
MSTEAVAELMDRWTNEPSFREQLRSDPEGTVRASGVQLDVDEMAALRTMDWDLPDDALADRVSKTTCA